MTNLTAVALIVLFAMFSLLANKAQRVETRTVAIRALPIGEEIYVGTVVRGGDVIVGFVREGLTFEIHVVEDDVLRFTVPKHGEMPRFFRAAATRAEEK